MYAHDQDLHFTVIALLEFDHRFTQAQTVTEIGNNRKGSGEKMGGRPGGECVK